MAHGDGHHGHHIIPFKTLRNVFIALLALTVLTVLTAKFVDIGPLNLPLALAIASVKAFLVISIFMALKYDNRVNALVFSVGSIFVVVFLVFTLFDTVFRGDVGNVDDLTVDERTQLEERLRAEEPPPEALRIAPADYIQDDTPDAAPADTAQAAPAETATADTTQAS